MQQDIDSVLMLVVITCIYQLVDIFQRRGYVAADNRLKNAKMRYSQSLEEMTARNKDFTNQMVEDFTQHRKDFREKLDQVQEEEIKVLRRHLFIHRARFYKDIQG